MLNSTHDVTFGSIVTAGLSFIIGFPIGVVLISASAAVIGITFTESVSYFRGLRIAFVGGLAGFCADIILIDRFEFAPRLAMALTFFIVLALTIWRLEIFKAGSKIIDRKAGGG